MYRQEFPDYDGEFFILDGWEDNSWHNDTCPHIEKRSTNGTVRAYVWQDYADPSKREYENQKRYLLQIHVNYDLVFHYETDDLEEIKRLAEGVQI